MGTGHWSEGSLVRKLYSRTFRGGRIQPCIPYSTPLPVVPSFPFPALPTSPWHGLVQLIGILVNLNSGLRPSWAIRSFHFLDQFFAETKDWDQTAQLWSQSRVQINQLRAAHITAHSIMTSLTSSAISPYFFVYLWICKKWSDFRLSKLNLSERLRPNRSTLVSAAWVEFNQSRTPARHRLRHRRSSLISPYYFVYFWISVKVK